MEELREEKKKKVGVFQSDVLYSFVVYCFIYVLDSVSDVIYR